MCITNIDTRHYPGCESTTSTTVEGNRGIPAWEVPTEGVRYLYAKERGCALAFSWEKESFSVTTEPGFSVNVFGMFCQWGEALGLEPLSVAEIPPEELGGGKVRYWFVQVNGGAK